MISRDSMYSFLSPSDDQGSPGLTFADVWTLIQVGRHWGRQSVRQACIEAGRYGFIQAGIEVGIEALRQALR